MITHDHQLIFVHIPKCAGRSVCDIFNQRFDHYTAQFYESEYNKFWQKYQRMTIVRHPLDRYVSLYIYIKNHRRHINEPIGLHIEDFNKWLYYNMQNFSTEFGYGAEGLRGTDGDLGSPFWFTSQWKRIVSRSGYCDIPKSNIFHLDGTMGMKEVETFLAKVTGQDIKMPHSNKSEYTDWRSFYSNEMYALASTFSPVVEDCRHLNYTT